MGIMTFGMVFVAKQSRIIENGTHTHECHRFEKRNFACASISRSSSTRDIQRVIVFSDI